jgi:flagellar hook-associated protein 3 FlgL
MTRVATLAQHERNLAHILTAMERLNTGQLQISSGRKSENYTGIAHDARRLVNVEAAHVRTTQYIANNKLVDQRLQAMETSVSQIFDVMTQFKTLLVNGLNASNASDLAMPLQAQGFLDQITALLNVQDDGRHLFAGSRTDTRPVDQSFLPAAYTVPSGDGDAAAYYQGDTNRFSVRADENFSIEYGIHAGEQGFERAIRAADMIVKGGPGDRDTMEHALAVVNSALNDISDIRTRIGASRQALENVNHRHEDFLLFTEKTISDIENVDIPKIITQMTNDQTAVEASYTVLGRLSRLNLASFLR